ncbi:hypothetical protein BDQ12DRAFT_757408, partial [Crucibulum laeve]
ITLVKYHHLLDLRSFLHSSSFLCSVQISLRWSPSQLCSLQLQFPFISSRTMAPFSLLSGPRTTLGPSLNITIYLNESNSAKYLKNKHITSKDRAALTAEIAKLLHAGRIVQPAIAIPSKSEDRKSSKLHGVGGRSEDTLLMRKNESLRGRKVAFAKDTTVLRRSQPDESIPHLQLNPNIRKPTSMYFSSFLPLNPALPTHTSGTVSLLHPSSTNVAIPPTVSPWNRNPDATKLPVPVIVTLAIAAGLVLIGIIAVIKLCVTRSHCPHPPTLDPGEETPVFGGKERFSVVRNLRWSWTPFQQTLPQYGAVTPQSMGVHNTLGNIGLAISSPGYGRHLAISDSVPQVEVKREKGHHMVERHEEQDNDNIPLVDIKEGCSIAATIGSRTRLPTNERRERIQTPCYSPVSSPSMTQSLICVSDEKAAPAVGETNPSITKSESQRERDMQALEDALGFKSAASVSVPELPSAGFPSAQHSSSASSGNARHLKMWPPLCVVAKSVSITTSTGAVENTKLSIQQATGSPAQKRSSFLYPLTAFRWSRSEDKTARRVRSLPPSPGKTQDGMEM